MANFEISQKRYEELIACEANIKAVKRYVETEPFTNIETVKSILGIKKEVKTDE